MADPMPLKHDTETRLIILLGLMIALAGAVSAFLPPVSVSALPWLTACTLGLAYPLLLYPTLRSHRADYPFRLLHFVPVLILLVWLALELLASAVPSFQFAQTLFTLCWSGPAVLAAFLLLIVFCVRVIRQRARRITVLLLVLLPFLALGAWSDLADWDRSLTALVWDEGLFDSFGTNASGNLLSSTDPLEEQWRIELRLMEQRRQRLLRGETGGLVGIDVTAPGAGTQIASMGLEQRTGTGDSIPPRLPSSGFGVEALAVAFLAGASAAIHRRTIGRGKSNVV